MTFLEDIYKHLDYNPETGEFRWKVSPNRKIKRASIAGCVDITSGYWRICFQRKVHLAHRLAWLIVHSKYPDGVIDHIDGDRSNNKISNLRDVSNSVNMQNQIKAVATNKTGLLGVCWDRYAGKFKASIKLDGKSRHIGYFATPEEASAAYLAAKRELHEGCTI